MNITRLAAATLALALAAPAASATDKQLHGLARLYQAAAERDDASAKRGHPARPETHATAVQAPVHAVMRVETLADGSYGVVCETEPAPAGGLGPVLGNDRRRERQ